MGVGEFLWDHVFRLAMTGTLFLLTIVMMIPLISALALPLSSKVASDMNTVNLLPVDFTFDSQRYILSNRDTRRAFFITVAATVSGVVPSLTITSLFAYPLSKKEFKASKLLVIVMLATMIFKAPVVPYFSTLKNIGLFNNLLVLVLPQISTAHNMITMRSFFQQFPKEVEEVTVIDGTSRFKVFYQVVLPSSKTALATVRSSYGVALWGQFQRPMMFIQNMKLFPLQMKVRRPIGSGSEPQNVAAPINVNYSDRTLQVVIVAFTILPITTVYPFIQEYFTRGAMLDSVKG